MSCLPASREMDIPIVLSNLFDNLVASQGIHGWSIFQNGQGFVTLNIRFNKDSNVSSACITEHASKQPTQAVIQPATWRKVPQKQIQRNRDRAESYRVTRSQSSKPDNGFVPPVENVRSFEEHSPLPARIIPEEHTPIVESISKVDHSPIARSISEEDYSPTRSISEEEHSPKARSISEEDVSLVESVTLPNLSNIVQSDNFSQTENISVNETFSQTTSIIYPKTVQLETGRGTFHLDAISDDVYGNCKSESCSYSGPNKQDKHDVRFVQTLLFAKSALNSLVTTFLRKI